MGVPSPNTDDGRCAAAADPGQDQFRGRRGRFMRSDRSRTLVTLLLAALSALPGPALLSCRGGGEPAGIVLNGRIEAPTVDLAPKVQGRVIEVLVREGDRVKSGDLLVRLDLGETTIAVERDRAGVASAEARVRDYEAGSRPPRSPRPRRTSRTSARRCCSRGASSTGRGPFSRRRSARSRISTPRRPPSIAPSPRGRRARSAWRSCARGSGSGRPSRRGPTPTAPGSCSGRAKRSPPRPRCALRPTA